MIIVPWRPLRDMPHGSHSNKMRWKALGARSRRPLVTATFAAQYRMARVSRNVAGLVLGVASLIGAAALAQRRRSRAEIRLFRLANELPDAAYGAIWVPMQYGTFATVPAAAVLALARGRPRLALSIGAGGTAAWVAAKAVKPVVDRGRPASIIEGVVQRGNEEGDEGFPSGHAAVSAALTVVSWPYLSDGSQLTAAALSAIVPLARMYVGAHLPLDVVGGSALGLAIACAVNLVAGRAKTRPS